MSTIGPPEDRGFEKLTWDQVITLWEKYEDVTMHFNGLLMQLRQRALGGLTAIVAIGAIAVKLDPSSSPNWGVLAAVFALLLTSWSTIWAIDVFYYSKLLHGAVDGLKEIEKNTAGAIVLSTRIEGAFVTESSRAEAKHFFFVPVAVLLAAGLAYSANQAWSTTSLVQPDGRVWEQAITAGKLQAAREHARKLELERLAAESAPAEGDEP